MDAPPPLPIRTKPRREQLAADANLCEYCTAKCCRYIALPIDAPDDRTQYDFVRWFLLHERATVFTENGEWFLLMYTNCEHLQHDGRCGIYTTRPQICRDYSTKNCEYEEDWTYDQYFEFADQLEEYQEALLAFRPEHRRRGPRPELLPVLS